MDGFLVGTSKFDASSGFIMLLNGGIKCNAVIKLSETYREVRNLFERLEC